MLKFTPLRPPNRLQPVPVDNLPKSTPDISNERGAATEFIAIASSKSDSG